MSRFQPKVYLQHRVAWRLWFGLPSIPGQLLSSRLVIWPKRLAMVAKCRRGDCNGKGRLPHSPGTCGIYAAESPQTLLNLVVKPITGYVILGTVALWGHVCVHRLGYRAQYAYPLKIYCQICPRCRRLIQSNCPYCTSLAKPPSLEHYASIYGCEVADPAEVAKTLTGLKWRPKGSIVKRGPDPVEEAKRALEKRRAEEIDYRRRVEEAERQKRIHDVLRKRYATCCLCGSKSPSEATYSKVSGAVGFCVPCLAFCYGDWYGRMSQAQT